MCDYGIEMVRLARNLPVVDLFMKSKIEDYKTIIVPLILKRLPRAKIILYGSRARGDWREGSDIDVAIDMKEKVDFGVLASIASDIEESVIPVNCDVVDLNAVSQDMRQEILKDGIVWHK